MSVSEPAKLSMAPLELVQRALPVTSADALLQCLADEWLRAAAVDACHVSLIADQKLSCVLAEPLRSATHLTGSQAIARHTTEWSATLASQALASMADQTALVPPSVTVVPFEFGGRLNGGALLLGDVNDVAMLATLAATSAQLIEQLRMLPSSTPHLDPAAETRLRDLKLEAMAEFAAGAGHEINNPVATIAGRSALLLKSETDPERRRILETIGGQAYRIRDMIGDAITFARPPEPVFEEFAPAADVLEIRNTLQKQFPHTQATFESSLDETINLNADREQFRVVVSCLIKNSLEAISDEGTIRLELSRSAKTSGQASPRQVSSVRFAVDDNGVGLTRTEREHLFDPFFSGRQAGRGLGFGLAKCWQILRLHGGTIEALESDDDRPERGLTVVTSWPA